MRCGAALLLALAIGLGGCTCGPAGGAADAGVPWPAGVAPYPGARKLCSGRATAGLMRITWTAYATPDAPARVRAFYGLAGDGGAALLRGPQATTLAVHPAAAADYPRCPRPPGAGDRTVIIVSKTTPRF